MPRPPLKPPTYTHPTESLVTGQTPPGLISRRPATISFPAERDCASETEYEAIIFFPDWIPDFGDRLRAFCARIQALPQDYGLRNRNLVKYLRPSKSTTVVS